MATLGNFVKYETHQGQPRQFGTVAVTPVAKTLSIKLPYWGFVWNRPVAAVIEDGESTTEMAIVDVTLLVQFGLLAFGLAAAIIGILARLARSR